MQNKHGSRINPGHHGLMQEIGIAHLIIERIKGTKA
jgi:hypothetical protein